MWVGHYASSFLLKQVDRRIPLWLLFLAAQFVDILWAVFILLGIEKVRIVPGFTASNPLDLYYMPYTHSLVASVGWATVVSLLYGWGKRTRDWPGPPWVLGAAVLSHWFLDLIVHVPDLPIYGVSHKVGFGLWQNMPLAMTVETLVLMVPLVLFARGTYARPYLLFGVALCVMNLGNTLLPSPPSSNAMAALGLAGYLGLAFVAYWVEHRAGRTSSRSVGKSR
jgi:hypothetical protein